MAPLAWIRRIAAELPETNPVPLFGKTPPFDWDSFSSDLAARLGISAIRVRPHESRWREGNEIQEGLGSHLHIVPIAVSPVGTAHWMISGEDLGKLTSRILQPAGHGSRLSEPLSEGFYQYLILESLDEIQTIDPFSNLTLQLAEQPVPFERAYCIDVKMEFDGTSCWGRLALPEQLRSGWVQHFSEMPSEYFPKQISREIEVSLGIKIGSAILHQKEWNSLQPGDFLLPDQGSYDMRKQTGICLLMLESTPIFNARINRHQIELAEYAFYYEDNMEYDADAPPEKTPSSPNQEGEVTAIKDLPLYVTIEIARLKMTLDHLMHLSPGNTIDLPVHPDQGVSLSINGRTVGRGELVYLGERLGVRILEI